MRVIPKGWGSELWITNADKYCGKFLNFRHVGDACSLHCHHEKEETFYVLAGVFKVILWDDVKHAGETYELRKGQTLDIVPYLYHRMMALEDASVLIEISTHHDDDDSYRKEKDETDVILKGLGL